MSIPYNRGDVVSYLNENAEINSVDYDNNGTIVIMKCRKMDFDRYSEYVLKKL
jgi:GTP-binding protein HflX